MKIHCAYDKLVSVDELKPHSKNANRHPKDQIKRLAKILDYQGFRYPVKVSKQSGFVTSGHGRIEAAKLNGWKEVPVNFQDYESMDQEIADLHADNAIASWAEFDLDFLSQQLPEINIDLELLGLKELPQIEFVSEIDEDEVPEVKEEPISKLGDLYQLGEHRLLCGDSTNIQHVERLMNGEKADMVFTDPPYNLGFEYNSHDDNMEHSAYMEFCVSWYNCIKTVSNKIIITPGTKNLPMWMKIDSEVQGIACWIKKNWITSCKISNLQQWEPILFYGPFERSRSSDLYEINRTYQKDVGNSHTCPKQIELLEDIFKHYGDKSILDLFGGSGSTLIACEKTNRKCFMSELDNHYVDVIVRRWEKFTGKTAYLIEDSSGKLKEPVPFANLDSFRKANT